MTTWDPRANELFLKALELRCPGERRQYLDGACAGDAALRAEVESLLEASARASGFLESPAVGATIDEAPAAERPGTVIGPYKLLQQIGEGGMGVVFMAEQTQPVKRKVALKLIKPGMDSRQVVARFEAERQALAMMDHVNIARVFDAGATDSGRPYFVMELVHGVPITKYCDDNQLTPRQRLELFEPVCQAIQHAHQKGVIHRDIKPSNVMITLYDGKPVPKVIDFGVAKATEQKLTERTLFTQYGAMVGTPQYMSPEQAEMSALGVDTRSDVYSLGVLLYELLTGSTPLTRKRFKDAAYGEILRIIKEEEPPKPSTRLSDSGEALASISAQRKTEPAKLSKLMRGELDWIVMKALEKDRGRRYETASGFAADIERYLADEPVQACPPSASYRLRKFARRNRGRLAAAAVSGAALLIVVGAVAGSLGWAARDRATREATTATRVGQVLGESEDLYRQRKLPEATQLARNALALVDGGAGGPELERRAREWLNDLDMVARLDIRTTASLMERSLDEYLQAFREYGIDVEALPPGEAAARIAARPIRVDLAVSLDRCVVLAYRSPPKGEDNGRALRARLGEIARLADPDPLRNRLRDAWLADESTSQPGDASLRELAASADLAATPIVTLMQIGDAQEPFREKIAFYTRVQQQHPGDYEITYHLGRMLRISANFPEEGGTPEDLDRAIRFLTAAVAIRPTNPFARSELGLALGKKGLVDEAVAAFGEATRLRPESAPSYRLNVANVLMTKKDRQQEAIATYRELVRADPNSWAFHHAFGQALRELGRTDEAIPEFREAIRLAPNPRGGDYNLLGLMLEDKGLGDEAIAAYREAIRLDPKAWVYRFNLGLALDKKGALEEAIAAFREAVRLNPTEADAHRRLGFELSGANRYDEAIIAFQEAVRLDPKDEHACGGLGYAFFAKGRWDEAIVAYRAAVRLNPDDADWHADFGNTFLRKGAFDEANGAAREAIRLQPNGFGGRLLLARVLLRQRRTDEAIAEFREAISLQKDIAEAHQGLGDALAQKGQLDDAIAAYRAALRIKPAVAAVHHGLGNLLGRVGKFADAEAEYREAIRLDPKFAALPHLGEMLCQNLGDFERGIPALREAVRLGPENPNTQAALGNAYARTGRWTEAVAAFDRVRELAPTNHDPWYVGAALDAWAGDLEGYRRTCQEMLKRFGDPDQPQIAERTAKACLLLPDALDAADFDRVQKLAERAVTGTEKNGYYRYFALAKGLADYRAGRHAEAVKWLERFAPNAGGTHVDATAFAVLAMAEQSRGRAEDAGAALAKAQAIVAKMPDPAKGQRFEGDWNDWLHARVLYREAEALLKNK